MKLFLDSSALAKRYIEEAGSGRVDELLAHASALGISVLAFPEVTSALCRRRREKTLNAKQYSAAKAALIEDVGDAEIINLTDTVVVSAVGLLEESLLRAADAMHVACAREWGAGLFVSADGRQCTAARAVGLKVEELQLADGFGSS
jgi:predicted nucleic acid-binding protein